MADVSEAGHGVEICQACPFRVTEPTSLNRTLPPDQNGRRQFVNTKKSSLACSRRFFGRGKERGTLILTASESIRFTFCSDFFISLFR